MKYRLTTITAALLLAACSAPPEKVNNHPQPVKKETKTMPETKTTPQTQWEILTRILEMMASAQSDKDFSIERLEQTFGVKMKRSEKDDDDGSFFTNLSKNWDWYMDKYKDPIEGQDGVDFSFEPTAEYRDTHKVSEEPNITEICDMDYDEFVRKAETLGFTQTPNIVQDGMQRGGLFK
ncbi:hypothetical protein BWD09_04100 [Neisseria dentiae]|uniref:Lipoprotein n=1 Tax=Neisseria dentiae TaxID=194197 RepID=A0A1X3DDG4_9NEIS|nr:hypothetical protein [Neisseria dentiae]OSI17943.1 hypothetical protein BWD09_04100 [Neisseria dentiae]QMT45081.1 hypothetical protein H3L92_11880 [Neisseria dentiae]STZ50835.1 Uncharacterised protein [Neisseria dentiae]